MVDIIYRFSGYLSRGFRVVVLCVLWVVVKVGCVGVLRRGFGTSGYGWNWMGGRLYFGCD